MASEARPRILIAIVIAAVVIGAVIIANWRPSVAPAAGTEPPPPPPPPPPPEPSACPRPVGLCVERNVTHIIDGDTLDIEGNLRIRLVLVDAPELGTPAGQASRDYLSQLCLGAPALVDEDDLQIGDDPFGRILAVVHCHGTNANGAMISSGHAATYYEFCSTSEFGGEDWTGCESPPPPPPPPPDNCDPAYPDVCIPPPPPDLNCDDISYRNFRVLPPYPDPHGFDGDRDGFGCEGP